MTPAMKRFVALLGAAVLLGAGSVLLTRAAVAPQPAARRVDVPPAERAPTSGGTGPVATGAHAALAPARAAARGDAVPRAAPEEVLPPADMPLRDAFAALDQAARRGQAEAACRLGAELSACRSARAAARYQMPAERMAAMWAQQRLDEKQVEQRLEHLLRTQDNLARRLAHCEGMQLDAVAPPAHYFMLAADAGHVPSMVQALHAEQYSPAALFRDPALIPRFRANALRYLHGALEAGDPAVVEVLRAASHMPEFSTLAPLLPEAWRSAGFATALQTRVRAARGMPRPAAPPGAWIPEATVPTAADTLEAERVFARYFENKLQPLGEVTVRPPDPASVERFRCGETAE